MTIDPSSVLQEHDIPESVKEYFAQQPVSLGKVQLGSYKPVAQIGQVRGLGDIVLAEGWSGIEPWGVWSDGNQAVFYVRSIVRADTTVPVREGLPEVIITAKGAVSEFHRMITIRLTLGTAREEFVFKWPDLASAQIKLPVPVDLANDTVFRIALEVDFPRSPHEQTQGVNPDRRRTGLGIRSVEIRRAGVELNECEDALRSDCYAVRLGVANVIALTMVYNEGEALRRWLKHYGRHLGERNLLVVDDGSNDGSTDDLGVAGRLTIPKKPFDDGRRAELISDLQRDLLRYYDAVIYTDCDEFLIPDPRRFANLRQYVDQMSVECARPVAFNLIHIRDREQPLDTSRGLLEQRSYCQFYARECKPLVARVPIRWHAGFHDCDRKVLLDAELLLVHAKFVDFTAALARLALTRGLAWSERSATAHWGDHWRASDEQLIGSFDAPERFLRQAGDVGPLCPRALAERANAQIDRSLNPNVVEPYAGPLSRVPEWLRGTV